MEGIGIWGVTAGKGSGIGKKLVNILTDNGYDNIYIFGRNGTELEAVARDKNKIKGWFLYDIENEDKTDEYAKYILQNNIHTIISSIGYGKGDTLDVLSKTHLMQMVNSNFVVPSLILKSSLSPLNRSGGGRVILLSSIVAIVPREGYSGYTGSKIALKGLVESSRYELRNIYTNVSIHSIYSTSFELVEYRSIYDTVIFLMSVKYGVHADVILSVQ